jgi:gluconokinase
MGVSACGKTTLARQLTQQAPYASVYIEADDYHSIENRTKMASGTPLTDEDRWPWLEALCKAIQYTAKERDAFATPDQNYLIFVACSCLRQTYRHFIRSHITYPLHFFYLCISPQCARARSLQRQGHFMPTTLIDSQFATLEPPTPQELATDVSLLDASHSVQELQHMVLQKLYHLFESLPL